MRKNIHIYTYVCICMYIMYMAPSQAYVGYQDPPLETAQEAPTIVAEGGPS